MKSDVALECLSALGHASRLAVFRLLVRVGRDGLPAGAIAGRLGIPPSTLSFHLAQLKRAGLLRSERRQREIIYAANYDGTRRLLDFLMTDCCRGRPEICGSLAPIGARPPTRDQGDLP